MGELSVWQLIAFPVQADVFCIDGAIRQRS